MKYIGHNPFREYIDGAILLLHVHAAADGARRDDAVKEEAIRDQNDTAWWAMSEEEQKLAAEFVSRYRGQS